MNKDIRRLIFLIIRLDDSGVSPIRHVGHMPIFRTLQRLCALKSKQLLQGCHQMTIRLPVIMHSCRFVFFRGHPELRQILSLLCISICILHKCPEANRSLTIFLACHRLFDLFVEFNGPRILLCKCRISQKCLIKHISILRVPQLNFQQSFNLDTLIRQRHSRNTFHVLCQNSFQRFLQFSLTGNSRPFCVNNRLLNSHRHRHTVFHFLISSLAV